MSLRLSVKTWTDPKTKKMYLVPTGALDIKTEMIKAVGLRDDENVEIEFTIEDWNNLPYYFFKEDGKAPKPEHRTVNVGSILGS